MSAVHPRVLDLDLNLILDVVPEVPLACSLQPHREYDMPPEPHVGRGAALRVPVSAGPASKVLERGTVPDTDLIEREPKIPPHRLMELPIQGRT